MLPLSRKRRRRRTGEKTIGVVRKERREGGRDRQRQSSEIKR